jgi:hypothetical protein
VFVRNARTSQGISEDTAAIAGSPLAATVDIAHGEAVGVLA